MKKCDILDFLSRLQSNRQKIDYYKDVLNYFFNKIGLKKSLDIYFVNSPYVKEDLTKAYYENGKILIKKKNEGIFCIQNLIHEALHSLENDKWKNLGYLKEGLIEFISAYFLYLHINETFPQGLKVRNVYKCTVSRLGVPCSINERTPYALGYSVWATFYKFLKLSFQDFLNLLVNFKSNKREIDSFVNKMYTLYEKEMVKENELCEYLSEYLGEDGVSECKLMYLNKDLNIFEEN